ncbi:MAG: hypothetical protein M3Q10_00195, partial [Chloroflexota bacterium]|nr:hypothetical protein [Chloroflexota bacterium]
MRVPPRRPRPRVAATVRFHALAALFLLLGLLAPLAPLSTAVALPASAQRGGDPPPLPAPTQVAAVGSFQTALGCPADYDPGCALTQLSGGGDGTWSAVLPIPPGDYALRIATDGGTRSLGQGGDPDGADVGLSVPPEAAGAYVAYDALTGTITAEPVDQLATLVTEVGDEIPLAPARGGGYETAFDAQPGTYGFQVLFDGEPVAQDTIALDAPSRVAVAVDAQGNVSSLGTVPDTVLEVAKLDAAGSPLPGACFAVRDGGSLVGQACDADDGEDGTTIIRVPNGLPAGTYELAEVSTPDGQPAADDQRIELGPGRYAADAVAGDGQATDPSEDDAAEEDATEESGPGIGPAAGEETPEAGGEEETPAADEAASGRLVLRPTDEETGDPVPGACFLLVELGLEQCDDDADGDVVFEGVAAGFYTLAQAAAPDGYRAIPDAQIEVGTEGARLRVPLRPAGQGGDQDQQGQDDDAGGIAPVEPDVETPEADATEETDPAATQDAGEGALALSVRDEQGEPVVGGCFALAARGDEGGGQPIEVCDGDDGGEDGELLFDPVPAGRFRLEETRTPEGRQAIDPEDVAIEGGQIATLTVASQAAEALPGTLVILVEDEDGSPVGETCFALESDAASFDNVCDQGNDGRLNIPDIPAGEYRVRQLQTAPGREVAEDETVTVPAGGREDLTVVNPPSEAAEPTEAPTAEATEEPSPEAAEQPAIQSNLTGSVLVLVRDEDGNAVGGARAEVLGGDGAAVRDDGANDGDERPGRVLLAEIEPGASALRVEAPDGYEAPADQPVAVEAGETARVEVVLQGTATPTAEPTEAAPEEPGTLVILAEDADGQPLDGACYTITNNGETFGPFCDENANGDVVVTGVSPGEQTVEQTTPPRGAGEPDETVQETSIDPGDETTLTFVHGADEATTTATATAEVEETGSVLVTVEANGQPLAGACVELVGEDDTLGPVCDAGVAAPGWRAPLARQGAIALADADPEGGRILIENVPVGDYDLRVVDAPQNFLAPAVETVTVEAGETAETSLTLEPEGATLATLTVLSEDEAGDPLGFACYTLTNPNGTFPSCDEDGDGAVQFTEVGPGEKVITQTTPPTDAGPAEETEQTITVEEGEDAELTFVHGPALGAVEITAAFADGDPAPGGCYELDGPQGYAACDDGDGDADPS